MLILFIETGLEKFTFMGEKDFILSVNSFEVSTKFNSSTLIDNTVLFKISAGQEKVNLKFFTRDSAIDFAKSNNIDYTVIEPKKRSFVIKSYQDNFTKN